MIIHQIKDLSNEYVTSLLIEGLLLEKDQNYNPYSNTVNQNIFSKLRTNFFEKGNYIVLEDENGYVGSSGWYEYDKDTAIVFVRTFLRKDMRQQHLLSKYFLPEFFNIKYKKLWITINEHNRMLVRGFTRPSIGFKWHDDFKKFKPIGKKYINGMDQYIIECLR
jgi:hypothetical protein